MSEQIKKWCDAIMFHEDDLELGTCKTLKMITDTANKMTEELTALRSRIGELERENTELKVFGDKLIGQSAEIAQRAAYERCLSIIAGNAINSEGWYSVISAISREMEKGGE